MSDSVKIIQRPGAYEHPFSGQGTEFNPLGVQPDQTGIVLHETGFDPANGNWNFPSVLSPFWRLYYNRNRAHCVVFGDEYYELGPDHIFLIPDHQLFHCLGQRPTPSLWIHFSFNRKPALNTPRPILLKPEAVELNLIESLSRLTLTQEKDRIWRLSTALLNILVSRPEIQWRPALPEKLTRLIQFIETHAGQKIPNPLLAKKAGISEEGIYRLFRKHLDTSPANYINQIRIRKASYLLINTYCSIDEAAEQTGFPNRAYFSRVFKQVTGISPAAFRANAV